MVELTEEQIKVVVEAAKLITQALNISMRADQDKNLSASTGNNDLEFESVKSGRVMIVESLSVRDDTSSPTRIRLGYKQLGINHWLRTVPAPLATESVDLLVPMRLREGMAPIARVEGATSGDDLYANLTGYWIER